MKKVMALLLSLLLAVGSVVLVIINGAQTPGVSIDEFSDRVAALRRRHCERQGLCYIDERIQ